MMCAWKELLGILPLWMRSETDKLGKETLREVRLRIHAPPELILTDKTCCLKGCVREEDLHFVINTASRYSPWAAETVKTGYLSAPGGHRIGICGNVICKNDVPQGVRDIRSLCIRVARDFSGIAAPVPLSGSVLILGAPGWGKTTLLRDLIRRYSHHEQVGVVDERGELFPSGIDSGQHTDILTGCPKPQGMEMLLRTMGPSCIAVDEITAKADCDGLLQIANCGVHLLATAHGSSVSDYHSRSVYADLVRQRIFDVFLVLRRDKTYSIERMSQ